MKPASSVKRKRASLTNRAGSPYEESLRPLVAFVILEWNENCSMKSTTRIIANYFPQIASSQTL